MRMPEPVLALIEYDFAQPPVQKYLYPVKSLRELRPDQCSPLCELDGDREWKLYTHLRPKEPGDYEHLELKLALKLPASAQGYQMAVSPEFESGTGEWEELRQYSFGSWSYFYMTTGFKKVRQKGGGIRWQPRSGGAAENSVSAGLQTLRISCAGETRYVRLKIYPAGLTEEDYQAILQDILLMQRQILIDQAGPVSVGGRWEPAVLNIQQQVERMEAAVRRLEAAPDRDLTAVSSRRPAYKIKRFTPRTLLDSTMGRRLLRTESHEESYNIYEHRMIRTYLENLKELASEYQRLERREQWKLLDEMDGFSSIPEDQPETEYLSEVIARQRKQMREKLEDIIAKLSYKQSYTWRSLDSGLCLWVTGKPDLFWNAKTQKYEVIIRSVLGGPEEFLSVQKSPGGPLFRVPHLTFTPKNVLNPDGVILFLLHCIQQLQMQWEKTHTPFQARFTGKFFLTNIDNDICHAGIYGLDRVDLGSQGLLCRYEDFFAGLKPETLYAYYADMMAHGFPVDAKDTIFYYSARLEQLDFQSGLLQKMDHGCWRDLEERIDRLIRSSPILCAVGTGERLRASNLFLKHPDYRCAYLLMRKNEKQLVGIDLWAKSVFRVGRTHQLYEVWCLLKILSIFIVDYSFTLCQPEGGIADLSQLIEQYLRDGKLNGRSFVLELRQGRLAGMRVQLDYDAEKDAGDGGNLRPDYFLKISTVDVAAVRWGNKSGVERGFCLDAKYRNYAPAQQTKWTWYEDLLEVAWDKYIVRLGRGTQVDGSYILHSDAQSSLPEIKKYFWPGRGGECGDVREYLFKRCQTPHIQERRSMLQKELGDLESCRIGAVCFTPSSDSAADAAFRGLLQMIMEHYFKLYRYKCWNCGSEDLDIQELETAGGNEKYHVVCRKCRRFWVETHCWSCKGEKSQKLGKHLYNYYQSQPGNPWDVICPVCRKSASSYSSSQL